MRRETVSVSATGSVKIEGKKRVIKRKRIQDLDKRFFVKI